MSHLASKYFRRRHILGKGLRESCERSLLSCNVLAHGDSCSPPPPPQTAMPYITLTLKYRFKRTCLSKNRHFLMRLNLFAKFFFSSLTCEVRQRPRVCYNGPNLGSTVRSPWAPGTVRGKWERGDQWTILCGQLLLWISTHSDFMSALDSV